MEAMTSYRFSGTVPGVRYLFTLVLLCRCSGPEAPDPALCRDVITRLCLGPICDITQSTLSVNPSNCESALLNRTGCENDSFGFVTPVRARVLECRVPLLRRGASQRVGPDCSDVVEVFEDCPDLVRFLGSSR